MGLAQRQSGKARRLRDAICNHDRRMHQFTAMRARDLRDRAGSREVWRKTARNFDAVPHAEWHVAAARHQHPRAPVGARALDASGDAAHRRPRRQTVVAVAATGGAHEHGIIGGLRNTRREQNRRGKKISDHAHACLHAAPCRFNDRKRTAPADWPARVRNSPRKPSSNGWS